MEDDEVLGKIADTCNMIKDLLEEKKISHAIGINAMIAIMAEVHAKYSSIESLEATIDCLRISYKKYIDRFKEDEKLNPS